MTNYTPEQLEHVLKNAPQARPRLLFRIGLSAKLYWRALHTQLPGHLLAKSVSFASATIVALLVVSAWAYVPNNPSVHAGTPLYPVKKAIESVETLAARSDEDVARVHLKQAQRRRMELRTLVGQTSVKDTALEKTLKEYVGSSQNAVVAAKRSANSALEEEVKRSVTEQSAELKSLQESSSVEDGGTLVSDDTEDENMIVDEEDGVSEEPVSGSGSATTSSRPATETEKQPKAENDQLLEDAASALEELVEETPVRAPVNTTPDGDSTAVLPGSVPTSQR